MDLDLDSWDIGDDLAFGPPPVVERQWHVILDFDSTITVSDTISPLMETAIYLNSYPLSSSKNHFQEGDHTLAARQKKKWKLCQDEYMKDYTAFKEGRRLLDENRFGNADGKKQCFLRDMTEIVDFGRPIEELSLARVIQTQILEGAAAEEVDEMARRLTSIEGGTKANRAEELNGNGVDGGYEGPKEKVQVRSGFPDFVANIEKRTSWRWGVISVNWSQDWIRGVMGAALSRERVGMKSIEITTNDLVDSEFCRKFIESGYTETPEYPLILGSSDKASHLRPLSAIFTRSTRSAARPPTLYIGDSLSDLSALLESDVGIIMLPSSTTRGKVPPDNAVVKAITDCGFLVRPVRDYKMLYTRPSSPTSTISKSSTTTTCLTPDSDASDASDGEGIPVSLPPFLAARFSAGSASGSNKAPVDGFVRLLCASGFEEILESGILDDAVWQPQLPKASMGKRIHEKNVILPNLKYDVDRKQG